MTKKVDSNPALEDMRPDINGYYIGDFNGKKRYIRFDLNAFIELEHVYGDMGKAETALSKGSMQDVRRFLWSALIWDEAILDEVTGEPIRYTLTMHEVGKWLTTSNMKPIMQQLIDALHGSVPEDENNVDAKVTPLPITTHALAAAGEETSPNA